MTNTFPWRLDERSSGDVLVSINLCQQTHLSHHPAGSLHWQSASHLRHTGNKNLLGDWRRNRESQREHLCPLKSKPEFQIPAPSCEHFLASSLLCYVLQMDPNARQWGRQVNTNKKGRFIDKESKNKNAGNKKGRQPNQAKENPRKQKNLRDTNQEATGNKSKKKRMRVHKEKTQDSRH